MPYNSIVHYDSYTIHNIMQVCTAAKFGRTESQVSTNLENFSASSYR